MRNDTGPTGEVEASGADAALGERQRRILDAAERCFMRQGFHRTTMQDVAVEAGMSPGNLYRYFPSKDAIVIGLTERDRADLAADFKRIAGVGNLAEAFRMAMMKHLIEEPAGSAALCMEIWSEATRNPVLREISHGFEVDVHSRIVAMAAAARDRGEIDPAIDLGSFAVLTSTLANGLYVRRAISASFDAEREIETAVGIIAAAMRGLFPLPASTAPTGAGAAAEERGPTVSDEV